MSLILKDMGVLVILSKFVTIMLSTFSIDCFDFPQSVLMLHFVCFSVFRLLCAVLTCVFVFFYLLFIREETKAR